MRTVRPSSSVKVIGVMSLVGQPCQLPVFLALAGSELTGWSMRRKLGTAPSSFAFAVAMLLPQTISFARHSRESGNPEPAPWLEQRATVTPWPPGPRFRARACTHLVRHFDSLL